MLRTRFARACLASSLFVFLVPSPCAAQADLYDLQVVRTFDLKFRQTNWLELLRANSSSDVYFPADLDVDGVKYRNVGVRLRGGSSRLGIGPASEKFPFRISMNEFVPGQRLLGYATIKLANGYLDPTFVRDVLTYRVLRRYMPAPKANYVRLVINREEWGPYVNIQSINKDLLREHFADEDGNRYRGERADGVPRDDSALTWLGPAVPPYQSAYELKSAEVAGTWTDLVQLCDVLNNTPQAGLRGALPGRIDVDSALWMFAVHQNVMSFDDYLGPSAHNFYLYHDPFHDRFSMMSWDHNGSFAVHGTAIPNFPNFDPFQYPIPNRPLLERVVADPRWRKRYAHHLRTVLQQEMSWPALESEILGLQARIDADMRADTRSLYGYQAFLDNVRNGVVITYYRDGVTPSPRPIFGIGQVVPGHAAFLAAHPEIAQVAPDVTGLSLSPAQPTPADPLTVTVRVGGAVAVGGAVTLFHRTRGPFVETAMFDDGQHGDGAAGDGRFGVVLAPLAAGTLFQYYVAAEAGPGFGSAVEYAPRTASHRAPAIRIDYPRAASDLIINEFLARNSDGLRDEAGETDDWIELRNVGARALDPAGMYLTDDLSQPTKWRMPSNTIPSGGSLIVWADEDPAQGPFHASFKLAGAGEEIYLFATDGRTILDGVRFGQQQTDVSTGRRRDGEQRLVAFPEPTPGRSNEIEGCGSRQFSFVDPTRQPIELRVQGTVQLGQTITFDIDDGPSRGLNLVLLDVFTSTIPLPFSRSILLLGPLPFTVGTVIGDRSGDARLDFTIPDDPGLLGRSFFFQSWAADAVGEVSGSNAVEMRYCR